MKKNSNYEVLHTEMKVIVTKKFLMAAGNPMNPEFDQMMEIRTRFAGYQIVERKIEKNPNKQTYGKLTYENMRCHIRGKETEERAEILLTELDTVIDMSKTQRASYTYVKKWFLNLYKEDFKTKKELEEEAMERIMSGDLTLLLGKKD